MSRPDLRRPAASRLARASIAVALALCAIAASARRAAAQAPPASAAPAWHDDSHHRVRRVSTAPGVELEVLDWGGTGEALIFLAGYGNTAHVWDDFAPRFTHGHHVIGITRRGFGVSSKPADGYDSETLAEDILAVMDELHILRASFVAHSFGGSELNWLAAHAGRRMIKLVYLDAAFDFAEMYASLQQVPGPSPRPRTPGPDAPVSAWTAWYARFAGPGYPESEVRAMFRVDSAGRLGGQQIVDSAQEKFMAGTARASFRQFYTPIMAIYAVPRTVREQYPWYDEMTPAEQRDAEARFAAERRVHERQRARFREEVHYEFIVPITGGRHYVFLSNDRDVEWRIRRFLSSSTSPRPAPRPNVRLSNWVTW
ncbi:MAG TPA: alpha/beta hydrolase [Longimicrobium sp.]|nr:alpha/beta hydrolase [Longimicrobium sp.]